MSSAKSNVPAPCTKQDLPGVIQLVDTIMRADSDQSMLTDYPLVYRDENLRNVRIIKAAGKVVAVVPFIRRPVSVTSCQFSIGIISPTATHPDYRHRGFGLACLQSCLQQMAADDIDLSVLWTRVPTFAFYDHGGYQGVRTQIVQYPCYRDDTSLFNDYGHQISEYNPASEQYLADIQRLHKNGETGVVRQIDAYTALFNLPHMKTLLALEGETVVAYLLVSQATNKFGFVEGGGDRAGLETLLHHALSDWAGDEPVLAYGYLTSSVLGDLLEQIMPERRVPRPGNMMIRMNQPRPFFERITPWLEQQNQGKIRAFSVDITDADERISFEFNAQGLRLGERKLPAHVVVTRQQLTSIVFGEHLTRRTPISDEFHPLFPFYFPIWVLDSS